MILLNNFKYSILYNFKKLNYRFILFFVLSIQVVIYFIMKEYWELNPYINTTYNNWDFYSSAYMNSDLLVSTLFFFSLYFIFNCFKDSDNERLIQIRTKSTFKWFSFKIASIFIFNSIISVFCNLYLIIIGIYKMGYGFTWSEKSRAIYVYSDFYSPQRIVFFNIITYSVFVTVLSCVLGILFIKIKNKKIPLIISIIYFILDKYVFRLSDKILKIIKYLSLNSYLIFNNRQFYKYENNYMTVKLGLIVPIILLGVLLILSKILISGKSCENY
ncbi:membrane-spanning permease [Clostridium tetani]|uniref:membrane-spanning permease n=1 Tax=Clostridium tetani TaxID=1513 RepID=UPI001FB12523|nr:membrane-spanning permease [Clostridium tetani]